jgi:hypothetical protein
LFWHVREKDKWEELFIMKKKQIALVALAVLLVPSVCMALPKVQLAPDCSYIVTIDGQGSLLLDSLAMFIDGLPTYAAADLENGAVGDGVPDNYQLGLLSAAMCAGETSLQAQFASNKNLIATQLIAPLGPAANLLFGTTNPAHLGIYAQAGALSADIRAWVTATPLLPPEVSGPAIDFADTIDELLLTIDTFLLDSDLTIAQLQQYVGIALPLLGQVQDLLAGLVGLDSEMIGILYTLLTPELQLQIDGYIVDVQTQMVPLLQNLHTQAGTLGIPPALDAKLVMAATDLAALANLVGPFVAFVEDPGFAIYGVSGKTASEPFAGPGDYNVDGVTNAAVLADLNSVGAGTRPNFVMAASGYMTLWPGRAAGVPVAGLVGMALLAGVVALGGALSLRKK